jgi:hypothetical protein
MIGGQRIQVGLPHAGKTAEITVETDTYQISVEEGINHHRTPQDKPRNPSAQGLCLLSNAVRESQQTGSSRRWQRRNNSAAPEPSRCGITRRSAAACWADALDDRVACRHGTRGNRGSVTRAGRQVQAAK